MINIRDLCFEYKNGSRILDGLNINIKAGEFVALIGQNGAGKTTLLKQLNGLLKPTRGSVFINNHNTAKTKTSVLAKSIGFLFQNPDHQIFCSTVRDEIAFGLKNAGIPIADVEKRVQESSVMVGMETYLSSNPFSLSKGQRQRVALASILAMDTDILVLDEPTTGQDYLESMEIMGIITKLNQKGRTIIIVTHDMELVTEYAKRVIILRDGRVFEDGAVESVMSKIESLEQSDLNPPQIYMLARRFHKQGLFKSVYTPKQMYEEILSYMEDERNVCNG